MLLRELYIPPRDAVEVENPETGFTYKVDKEKALKLVRKKGWKIVKVHHEDDVDEAVRTIWSRSGGKQVRKYRCTSGIRKGRIVARAATCNKPLNQKAKIQLTKTKRKTPNKIKINTKKTKRANPASKRLKRINVRPKKRFAGKRRMG